MASWETVAAVASWPGFHEWAYNSLTASSSLLPSLHPPYLLINPLAGVTWKLILVCSDRVTFPLKGWKKKKVMLPLQRRVYLSCPGCPSHVLIFPWNWLIASCDLAALHSRASKYRCHCLHVDTYHVWKLKSTCWMVNCIWKLCDDRPFFPKCFSGWIWVEFSMNWSFSWFFCISFPCFSKCNIFMFYFSLSI